MIKILKPATAPTILVERGLTRQSADCREYDTFPADYAAGTRTFDFDATIYGDATVKQALIAAQHGKCCFCDKKIGSEGDIEHFRPKAACRQGKRTRLEKPGYYWLAYDWNNLLLACPICNQRHKRNLFPLANPANRARNHHADVMQEEPLLLDPADVDPAHSISFRSEFPYAIGGSRHARETIRSLGLDRENLLEERREHLNNLILLRKVLDREELIKSAEGRRILEEARDFLRSAILDTAKFAAMARAASAKDFRDTLI